jgi:hypothetical protein
MTNPTRFSFFPAPAEGETAYSWIARYHLMSGHASFRANTMALLGVLHGRASNEFPSFLPQLSVAADMPLSTIIHHMTPYRFYATFLPEKLCQMLNAGLSTGQTRNLQSTIGTVSNRMTPGQQMYSCRHCIKEDIDEYGFPFWHLLHQLTGVVSCSRHHELLHAVPRIQSQAMLPKSFIERPSNAMEDRYVTLIQDMHTKQNNMLSKQQCLLTYRRRLYEMKILTPQQRIRFQQLRELIGSRLKGVEVGVGAFDHLKQQLSNAQFPECLFYQAHGNHHPLKHLVLIDALFESWHEFTVEVNKIYMPLEAQPVVISERKQSIELSHKAQALLRSGRSLRAVSKEVGVSVSTLKILAQRAGIKIDCRPSKVFTGIERAIWRLLMLGEKTSDIAFKFGISVGAVEKVLSKHPELVILRKQIWFYQHRKFHRSAILMHMDHNPTVTRKLIGLALGASYIWLYKHDKEWLYVHLPPEIPRSKRFQTKGVR